MLDALIWIVVGGVLAFMMWRVRRRRPHVGSGGAGAVYDLLNDDKRKAIEVVVDGRAERQDPEHADDTLADDGDASSLEGLPIACSSTALPTRTAIRSPTSPSPASGSSSTVPAALSGWPSPTRSRPSSSSCKVSSTSIPLPWRTPRTAISARRSKSTAASLFVVLHMLEIEGPELRVGEAAIFVGDHYVLSVRSGVSRGFSDVRARSEREPDLLRHGPAYVLYALMDAVVDRYFPVIDALEDEIDAVEARIFAGQTTRANIEALYDLKRKLMVLKHAAGPLTEATAKLQAGRVPPVCAGLVDYFRDVYDHLKRLNQSIENLRDTVTTATAVNLSLITLQESEVTKQLAAYAALAAVPTMIAGVYGMNFAQMPELQWVYGYPAVLG